VAQWVPVVGVAQVEVGVADDERVGADRFDAGVRDGVLAADEEGDGVVVGDASQFGSEVVKIFFTSSHDRTSPASQTPSAEKSLSVLRS